MYVLSSSLLGCKKRRREKVEKYTPMKRHACSGMHVLLYVYEYERRRKQESFLIYWKFYCSGFSSVPNYLSFRNAFFYSLFFFFFVSSCPFYFIPLRMSISNNLIRIPPSHSSLFRAQHTPSLHKQHLMVPTKNINKCKLYPETALRQLILQKVLLYFNF